MIEVNVKLDDTNVCKLRFNIIKQFKNSDNRHRILKWNQERYPSSNYRFYGIETFKVQQTGDTNEYQDGNCTEWEANSNTEPDPKLDKVSSTSASSRFNQCSAKYSTDSQKDIYNFTKKKVKQANKQEHKSYSGSEAAEPISSRLTTELPNKTTGKMWPKRDQGTNTESYPKNSNSITTTTASKPIYKTITSSSSKLVSKTTKWNKSDSKTFILHKKEEEKSDVTSDKQWRISAWKMARMFVSDVPGTESKATAQSAAEWPSKFSRQRGRVPKNSTREKVQTSTCDKVSQTTEVTSNKLSPTKRSREYKGPKHDPETCSLCKQNEQRRIGKKTDIHKEPLGSQEYLDRTFKSKIHRKPSNAPEAQHASTTKQTSYKSKQSIHPKPISTASDSSKAIPILSTGETSRKIQQCTKFQNSTADKAKKQQHNGLHAAMSIKATREICHGEMDRVQLRKMSVRSKVKIQSNVAKTKNGTIKGNKSQKTTDHKNEDETIKSQTDTNSGSLTRKQHSFTKEKMNKVFITARETMKSKMGNKQKSVSASGYVSDSVIQVEGNENLRNNKTKGMKPLRFNQKEKFIIKHKTLVGKNQTGIQRSRYKTNVGGTNTISISSPIREEPEPMSVSEQATSHVSTLHQPRQIEPKFQNKISAKKEGGGFEKKFHLKAEIHHPKRKTCESIQQSDALLSSTNLLSYWTFQREADIGITFGTNI